MKSSLLATLPPTIPEMLHANLMQHENARPPDGGLAQVEKSYSKAEVGGENALRSESRVAARRESVVDNPRRHVHDEVHHCA
jgi:hypothetical protein